MLTQCRFALGLIVFVWCASVHGATAILPASLASKEANDNFAFNSDYTHQQLFSGSAVAGLPTGALITGMEFRLDGGEPTNVASTEDHFDVRLGKATSTTLSTNFASNEAADTVLARSGPYTFAAGSLPGGATPNAFGSLISFTTPYLYTGGSLLLTLSYTDPSSDLLLDFQDIAAPISGLQSSGAVLYNATTAISVDNGDGFVVRFTYLPEPASCLSFMAALGCLVIRRRRLNTQR